MRRLLIRPGALGDCILSFPALQFLRTDYTEIWVPTPLVPLIHFADRVCSLSSTGLDLAGFGELPLAPALHKRLASFDEVVSWYGTNRDEFRSLLNGLGPRCVFHQALPSGSGTVPASDFFSAQVGAPPGAIPTIVPATLPTLRNSLVIHPFSGSPKKNWPLQSFQQLAASLNIEVEWLAGPEETLPQAHRFDNLGDLAVWLAGARLYLGNDSGITHLAAALGIPVIALFSTTSQQVWAPRGPRVTILQQQSLTVASLRPCIDLLLRTTIETCE